MENTTLPALWKLTRILQMSPGTADSQFFYPGLWEMQSWNQAVRSHPCKTLSSAL